LASRTGEGALSCG